MLVVETISQLHQAVRQGAREVMIVGKLAPEILRTSNADYNSGNVEIPNDFSFTPLFEKYKAFAVHGSNRKLIATVFQQQDDLVGM